MTNPDDKQDQFTPQEAETPQEQGVEKNSDEEDTNVDIRREISSYTGPKNRAELLAKEKEIQEQFQGLGSDSSVALDQEQQKQIRDKMVDEIRFYHEGLKRYNQLEMQEGEAVIEEYIKNNNLESLLQEYEISPTDDDCQVTIVIPSFAEGDKVLKTLESLTRQIDKQGEKVSPSQFEVIFVVNQRSSASAEDKELNQVTLEIIDKFRKGNSEFNIHAIFKEFDPENGGIGPSRRLGADLTLVRDSQRLKEEGAIKPFYIAGTDADTVMDSNYVSEIISNADKYGDPAYGGGVKYDDKIEQMLGEESGKKFREYGDKIRNKIVAAIGSGLQGANSAVRKDVYARMGGFSKKSSNEDVENDRKFRELGKKVELLETAHLTDSRRVVDNFYKMINDIRGKKTDWEKLHKQYKPVKDSEIEQADFGPEEFAEVMYFQKVHSADFIVDNLTLNNVNNPEMIEFIGVDMWNELKDLSKEEFEKLKADDEFKERAKKEILENIINMFKE